MSKRPALPEHFAPKIDEILNDHAIQRARNWVEPVDLIEEHYYLCAALLDARAKIKSLEVSLKAAGPPPISTAILKTLIRACNRAIAGRKAYIKKYGPVDEGTPDSPEVVKAHLDVFKYRCAFEVLTAQIRSRRMAGLEDEK